MKLYPEAVHARTRAIAKDVLLAVVLIALAWLGLRVYHTVDRLTVLGSGVEQAGTSVNQGFHTAADAVKGVPLVGHKLSSALGGAGQKTGGNVAHYGERGQQEVHKLARGLGLLTFGLPASIVLLFYLPRRIRLVRDLGASSRVLTRLDEPERRRLIAMRAAFTLPYHDLLAHTPDPLGDIIDGRYDALVAAVLEDAGLVDPVAS